MSRSERRQHLTYHVSKAVLGWWVIGEPGKHWVRLFTGPDALAEATRCADRLNGKGSDKSEVK